MQKKRPTITSKQIQIMNECALAASAKADKLAPNRETLAVMLGETLTYITLISKKNDFERWRKDYMLSDVNVETLRKSKGV